MGISRDSRHKRRLTGGRYPVHKKKRKYELGRPSSNTKLGSKLVRKVRCRGGNLKFRALRLDSGNFSWGSQSKFSYNGYMMTNFSDVLLPCRFSSGITD